MSEWHNSQLYILGVKMEAMKNSKNSQKPNEGI